MGTRLGAHYQRGHAPPVARPAPQFGLIARTVSRTSVEPEFAPVVSEVMVRPQSGHAVGRRVRRSYPSHRVAPVSLRPERTQSGRFRQNTQGPARSGRCDGVRAREHWYARAERARWPHSRSVTPARAPQTRCSSGRGRLIAWWADPASYSASRRPVPLALYGPPIPDLATRPFPVPSRTSSAHRAGSCGERSGGATPRSTSSSAASGSCVHCRG